MKKRSTFTEKALIVGGQVLPYVLKDSWRARRIRITVERDGRVTVTVPRGVADISKKCQPKSGPEARDDADISKKCQPKSGPEARDDKASAAEEFLRQHAVWALGKRALAQQLRNKVLLPRPSRRAYLAYKNAARELVLRRIKHFRGIGSFAFNSITIRNQKTRWGSCSRKKSLSFNYRLALVPERLADYVITHELCHLKELNHSPRFWRLLETILPDWRDLKSMLRRQYL